MRLFDRFLSELLRIGKFGIVGFLATFVHLLTFSLLMQFTSTSALLATCIAFLLAFTITFLGNFYWTFARTGPALESVLRLVAVSLTGLLVNAGLASLVVDYWSLHYLIATLSMAFTPLITYLFMTLWVFPDR